jgi:hypothetical protein
MGAGSRLATRAAGLELLGGDASATATLGASRSRFIRSRPSADTPSSCGNSARTRRARFL